MAKRSQDQPAKIRQHFGHGGETQQEPASSDSRLTTDQGIPVSDNQNSLAAVERGPVLLEDFVLREKITHFDHERIPERVVHARGYGAHGYFQSYKSHSRLTKAAFLQDSSVKTPVFVRFSTVAGSEGSADTARDVRGFAVKFYTSEGNYDLIGNNIPVFFIQDAIKFPDLIHAVKPEPDRAFPQAQSAHDTFWDFVSLSPESTHMLMWIMSDRAIPRSFRMMEGFGIHTFRFVNARGVSTFVKLHWRPKHGAISLIWDEAVKIAGADPDFHRRDLWNAIQAGDYPEWELSVQAFDQETADGFDFDVLDPTKLIPEEVVPLTPLGKMVLDRTVDNFFAETEQVAFCPANIVPGIEFSNDPLLQGRLFSYLDTQLSRLGSPNFHELPINAAKCPVLNNQRDAHMRHTIVAGRVAYEPNSLDPAGPRADAKGGYKSFAEPLSGEKGRLRPELFADHYTQARLFYRSLTDYEQRHVAASFAFELGKCQALTVRQRMLGNLVHVEPALSERVAMLLGMKGQAEKTKPALPPQDMPPSPALSQYTKAPASVAGRRIAVLITDGSSDKLLDALRKAAAAEGATVALIAPCAGGIKTQAGKHVAVDDFLAGAPSCLFDAIVVAPSQQGTEMLRHIAAAVDWIRDAFGHLKVIGYVPDALPLFELAHVDPQADEGLIDVEKAGFGPLIDTLKQHRIWAREPSVRMG